MLGCMLVRFVWITWTQRNTLNSFIDTSHVHEAVTQQDTRGGVYVFKVDTRCHNNAPWSTILISYFALNLNLTTKSVDTKCLSNAKKQINL